MHGSACDLHVWSVFVRGKATSWQEACGLSACVIRTYSVTQFVCVVFFTDGFSVAALVIFMFGLSLFGTRQRHGKKPAVCQCV